jgi:hypothetical protein
MKGWVQVQALLASALEATQEAASPYPLLDKGSRLPTEESSRAVIVGLDIFNKKLVSGS